MRNLEEFNDRHHGKPCFILGSGCSLMPHIESGLINRLSNYVSIAVNSGYLAFPESDFFISDDWSISHWSFFFDDLRNSSKTIALLYDKKLEDKAGWFGDRSVIFKHRKGYKLTKPYSHSEHINYIWEARTSVGSAIHAAYIMGCDPIVLLGMDCCRSPQGDRYFWQMSRWQEMGKKKPYRNDGVPIDAFPRCRVKYKQSDTDLKAILRYWTKVSYLLINKVHIYNTSIESMIDVFHKEELSTLLDSFAKSKSR